MKGKGELMNYNERKKLYKELEAKRGHPLICYVTSIRPLMGASIGSDVIDSVIKQLEYIPKDKKEVDFLIVSNGGDPITSVQIMNLLRERFDTVNALIPYSAFSAATILALGANHIVMHPYSNLGPVDPQLTVPHSKEDGTKESLQFSSEDISNYIDFIKTDVGITDQQHLVSVIQPLLKDLGSFAIGYSKRGQQLSLNLSEKMLNRHLRDSEKAKLIARSLNSSFYHHGYPVSRSEAKDIGLPIEYPDSEVEDLMWRIWQSFNNEMKCSDPFDVRKEIISNQQVKEKLGQYRVLEIPIDLPNDFKMTIYQNYLNNFQPSIREAIQIDNLVGSIESIHSINSFYNMCNITYWRDADAELRFSLETYSTGWGDYKGDCNGEQECQTQIQTQM